MISYSRKILITGVSGIKSKVVVSNLIIGFEKLQLKIELANSVKKILKLFAISYHKCHV